jgi:hypothetical protein
LFTDCYVLLVLNFEKTVNLVHRKKLIKREIVRCPPIIYINCNIYDTVIVSTPPDNVSTIDRTRLISRLKFGLDKCMKPYTVLPDSQIVNITKSMDVARKCLRRLQKEYADYHSLKKWLVHWKAIAYEAASNPYNVVCQKRLMREFCELTK